MVGAHRALPGGQDGRVRLVRLEVTAQLPQDVRHFLTGGQGVRILGTEDPLPLPGHMGVLAQGVGGAAGAAEGEADLVAAGEGLGVGGAEDVLAFGGDRAVHLTRLGPASEAPQAQARVVPPGQCGERLRRRGGRQLRYGLGRR